MIIVFSAAFITGIVLYFRNIPEPPSEHFITSQNDQLEVIMSIQFDTLQNHLDNDLGDDSLANDPPELEDLFRLKGKLKNIDTLAIEGFNALRFNNSWLNYYKYKMFYGVSDKEKLAAARDMLQYVSKGLTIWEYVSSKKYLKLVKESNSVEANTIKLKLDTMTSHPYNLYLKYNQLMAQSTILMTSDDNIELKNGYANCKNLMDEEDFDCSYFTEKGYHICIDPMGRFLVYLNLIPCPNDRMEHCQPKKSELEMFKKANQKIRQIIQPS